MNKCLSFRLISVIQYTQISYINMNDPDSKSKIYSNI